MVSENDFPRFIYDVGVRDERSISGAVSTNVRLFSIVLFVYTVPGYDPGHDSGKAETKATCHVNAADIAYHVHLRPLINSYVDSNV